MPSTRTLVQDTPARTGKLPLGMMTLLAYLAFVILTELVNHPNLTHPAHAFGAFRITGVPALGYSFVLIVGLGGALVGIVRRNAWARTITVIWFLLTMATPLLDLLSFLHDPQGALRTMRDYAQQYFQDYARNTHLPLDSTALVDMLADRQVLELFLVWDLIVQWGIGLSAIIYLYRQRAFFKA